MNIGASGGHMYTPWWLLRSAVGGQLSFHVAITSSSAGGRELPVWHSERPRNGSRWQLWQEVQGRTPDVSFFVFSGRGEDDPKRIASAKSTRKRRTNGDIPVLRFHWKWSQYELGQWRTCRKRSPRLVAAMAAARTRSTGEAHKAIKSRRECHPRSGRCRMGRNAPPQSPTPLCETWDVKNLF